MPCVTGVFVHIRIKGGFGKCGSPVDVEEIYSVAKDDWSLDGLLLCFHLYVLNSTAGLIQWWPTCGCFENFCCFKKNLLKFLFLTKILFYC